MKVIAVKSVTKTQIYILGFLAIASLFVVTNSIGQTSFTESKNARFNQWVKYYSKCEGYTVEYYDFETFKSESDVTSSMIANAMASEVLEIKQSIGFVTVYFDWEKDVIFFRGTGSDPTLLYCFFSIF